MKAVIQRVRCAQVTSQGEILGDIGPGLFLLLGIAPEDTPAQAEKLADKIARLRIFSDGEDKMNLSLLQVHGEALVVSNFTLYANCRHGCRPSFTGSAKPAVAEGLYSCFVESLKNQGIQKVATGRFGADMQIALVNDGPVTIVLDTLELMGTKGGNHESF